MTKQYIITLRKDEREQLLVVLKEGKASARKLCHVQVSL